MKLLSITISGFRNVANTTLELGGITALISPNNYGKSNLLEAIEFAFEFMSASSKQRASWMRATNCIPLSPSLENEDFRFAMEFDDPTLGEYRFVRYGFSFSWLRDDGTGCRITDETIEINSKRSGSWTNYLKRAKGKYKKSHDTRSFRSIGLDNTQLAIDVLTAIEDIDINPAIRSILSISYDICNSLDTSDRFKSIPLEFSTQDSDSTSIMFDDEDLSRALFRMKQNDPEKFENFQVAIYTLFPEFEDVSVMSYELKPEQHEELSRAINKNDEGESVPFRIKDELYRFMIKSRHLNQPVDISYMSTGTKRIVWLVANVMIAGASKAGCIGIEEIETSIHPRMTQELLEILNEGIGPTSLLLTSHSPFLVQYLKPEKIFIGVPNDDGVATFKRINPSMVKEALSAAYNRGLGLGEYLFELMSSNDDEARALMRLLEN